jgi:hypothetical protein
MHTASKVASTFFRFLELASASIVAGILGHFLHLVSNAQAPMPVRVIYAVAIAGISIVCSIVLLPPLRHTFYAFPLDAILFVLWMVAFGLLCNVSHLILHMGSPFPSRPNSLN